MNDHRTTVDRLLDHAGETFAAEAGITLRDQPAPLYRLLVLTVLLSSRVQSHLGTAACRELLRAGLGTPRRMRDASWQDRVDALDRANYTRTDEQTATALGEGADIVLERWRGDLRRMRAEADGSTQALTGFLTELPRIGPVGADIFLREVQLVWPEFRPYLDGKALDGAVALGLPHDASELAATVEADDLPRLAAALVRASRDGDLVDDVASGGTRCARWSRAGGHARRRHDGHVAPGRAGPGVPRAPTRRRPVGMMTGRGRGGGVLTSLLVVGLLVRMDLLGCPFAGPK